MTQAQMLSAIPATVDRKGQPLSYMTAEQADFFAWLNENATVVPVTGRDYAGLKRVIPAFHSWRIAAHGSLIINPTGSLDAEWRRKVKAAMLPYAKLLVDLEKECVHYYNKKNFAVKCRLACDGDLPLHLTIKHSNPRLLSELYAIRELPALAGLTGMKIITNDNNITILPAAPGKAAAVEYVLAILRAAGPVTAIGIGDSLSDLPFLGLCDWLGMPAKSQLADHISNLPEPDFEI